MKKISELSTKDTMITLARVTPLVHKLYNNKKVQKAFKNNQKEEESKTQFGIRIVLDLLPELMETEQATILSILAAVKQVTLKEVEDQSFMQTMKDIKTLMSDEDLLDFFKLPQELPQEIPQA